MILKQSIKLLIILSLVYSLKAIDFTRFYTVRGVLQPLTPLPTEKARSCLNSVSEQLIQCRNQSLKIWNVLDYSALGDVCCAQWDAIECYMDSVAESKCKSEEMDDVNDYFDDLIEFYNEKICHPFPRGSTHCVIPILAEVTHERPPPPSPLAIDCLANIRPDVRLACLETALHKWNVTHKRAPIKNLCCATWDDIDCLDEISKIRCPSTEITATEIYFQQIETWAANKSCKEAAYHSANCSKQVKHGEFGHDLDNIPELVDNYYPVVFPAKPEHHSQNSPYHQMDSDYKEFLMNYILTVFPHLMNLLILLSVILVTVIVIQCFMIGRHLKKTRCFGADLSPMAQGYQKVDV